MSGSSAFRCACALAVALCIAAPAAVLAPAPARAQAANTFTASCLDVKVRGVKLVARCRRFDATYAATTLEISGVRNVGGVLKYVGPSAPSDFQDSCTHAHMDGDTLVALCKLAKGKPAWSSVHITGVLNVDGVLQHQ